MAKYVDGFVLVIPKNKISAYRKIAKDAGRIWKKYGALDYKECIGDDLRPKGISLPFPKLAKTKPGETVVFSYILYKSRAHRDVVNAKVMKDPYMQYSPEQAKDMPFDMKRITFGGFEVLVDL